MNFNINLISNTRETHQTFLKPPFSNQPMKTSLSIISGYLGAGKTTLLKHIISKLNRKFAIIMNEFGDISIDTQIIQGKNVNIAELAGGCVCCSLTGEFEEAVKEIKQKYDPELIIVETTGVAEPDALVIDMSESFPDVRLDSVITVVDGDAIIRFPSIGRAGKTQIEMADILLLNKIDLLSDVKKALVREKIRKINTKAPIIETQHCTVDVDFLFGLQIEHHLKKVHGKHETSFESFTIEISSPLNREKFEQLLQQLPSSIYRIKGFIKFIEDSTYLFQYVAGRWNFELAESEKHMLVFIGEGIAGLKSKIVNTMKRM
jgi:G3E family GTPase